MTASEREQLLNALADYMVSEGCSCCSNPEEHDAAKSRLGELLRVPKYKDDSGYDFRQFSSKRP